MPGNEMTALEQEWIVLQQQADSFEHHCLLIKLFSIALCSLLLFHRQYDFVIWGLCGVCWLLDTIWKTFQSRFVSRLMLLEQAILEKDSSQAMQFNTRWQQQRGGLVDLLKSYLGCALTPTVVLPHGAIISIAVLVVFIV